MVGTTQEEITMSIVSDMALRLEYGKIMSKGVNHLRPKQT